MWMPPSLHLHLSRRSPVLQTSVASGKLRDVRLQCSTIGSAHLHSDNSSVTHVHMNSVTCHMTLLKLCFCMYPYITKKSQDSSNTMYLLVQWLWHSFDKDALLSNAFADWLHLFESLFLPYTYTHLAKVAQESSERHGTDCPDEQQSTILWR